MARTQQGGAQGSLSVSRSVAMDRLPPALRERVARRLRTAGLWSHLLGLWLRHRFQKAGIIVVRGGWPFPSVENHGGRIEVENCAFFSGVRLECWQGALIRIGNGSYLNRNTEIVAAQSVIIGRDCKIARDVIIMDTDQHPLPDGSLIADPVTVGDRVWIGARSIVLKGVTIGNDAVVGAGSVVTRDVPPRGIFAGVPARPLQQA
jgi:acetyltransferase-like isoleucine patch superfamily enzyme